MTSLIVIEGLLQILSIGDLIKNNTRVSAWSRGSFWWEYVDLRTVTSRNAMRVRPCTNRKLLRFAIDTWLTQLDAKCGRHWDSLWKNSKHMGAAWKTKRIQQTISQDLFHAHSTWIRHVLNLFRSLHSAKLQAATAPPFFLRLSKHTRIGQDRQCPLLLCQCRLRVDGLLIILLAERFIGFPSENAENSPLFSFKRVLEVTSRCLTGHNNL